MIAIVDFGSQFCHLIAKNIRKLGVYTEIVPSDVSPETLKGLKITGLVLSGGPSSILDESSPKPDPAIMDIDVPILGICYGHQLLASHSGGLVVKNSNDSHYGIMDILINNPVGILEGLRKNETVVLSHGDLVKSLPAGYEILSKSDSGVICFQNVEFKHYGIQFHPEVHHTHCGTKVLDNFLKISGTERKWKAAQMMQKSLSGLEKLDKPVLMAYSGGIDSTVAAALVNKVKPGLLHCVMVDNGLLRKNEAKEVEIEFTSNFPEVDFRIIDASDMFLNRLKGVIDPEEKRKVIGHAFIEVFEQAIEEIENSAGKFEYLCQGTIYPDRIESSSPSKNASVIKTHHNVGGLPERMKLKLIEPLKDLYKNEVRELGKKIGLPEFFINRHPFPGPGLAVRCLGEVTKERLQILRECDEILTGCLIKEGVYSNLWQAFAVLTGAFTTGVQGDDRTYNECIALRLVDSVDAMTADIPDLPMKLLKAVAAQIVNQVKGVNRVVFDLSTKPPATIEWE
ncbi:MAG: glutamine-hydrolyzing GMP synthase [Candidatus Hodarchaeales archaeon]